MSLLIPYCSPNGCMSRYCFTVLPRLLILLLVVHSLEYCPSPGFFLFLFFKLFMIFFPGRAVPTPCMMWPAIPFPLSLLPFHLLPPIFTILLSHSLPFFIRICPLPFWPFHPCPPAFLLLFHLHPPASIFAFPPAPQLPPFSTCLKYYLTQPFSPKGPPCLSLYFIFLFGCPLFTLP